MSNNYTEQQERFTDPCDIADLEIQRSLDRALKNHRNKKRLTACGKCLYCEESVSNDLLFCDTDCRDDYQKYIE